MDQYTKYAVFCTFARLTNTPKDDIQVKIQVEHGISNVSKNLREIHFKKCEDCFLSLKSRPPMPVSPCSLSEAIWDPVGVPVLNKWLESWPMC